MKSTCITINTDASWCPKSNAGGYAFYVICDIFKIQKGGYFKGLPKSSLESEMMCMANALSTVLAQKELPKCKYIIINSDCMHSFHRISRKSDDKIGRLIADLLRKLRLKTGMPEFDFRHVKAHSGKQDARSYVNEWCDKEAKKYMRIKRDSI